MNDLYNYGWNDHLYRQKQDSTFKAFMHGRISLTHKTRYEVIAADGRYTCELSGNMLYGRASAEQPCTGDWVIFQPMDAEKGVILDLLPRQQTLYRLKTGSVSEKQAIAAHVQKAFIVQSLDEHFSIRRMERFVVQVTAEQIEPVLVLTKTDLGFEKDKVEASLEHLSRRMAHFYTSIREPDTIVQLRASILPGESVVFAGMSGVGKSSLINALCGREILATSAISEATGKGRHTTTRREMVLMEGSGVLIDTPGMKLFGVTNDDEDNLSEVFDIRSFEGKCRFRDCQHINEEGCAVIEAVAEGELDRAIYENYLKLRKEARHFSSSVHEKRKREKSFARMVKEVKDLKGHPYKKP